MNQTTAPTLLERQSALQDQDRTETKRVFISPREAAAGLRVLVCVARADGEIRPDEKMVLEKTVETWVLPDGVTLEGLLDERIDLDRQLSQIASEEFRERTYNAAYCLAHLEGSESGPEQVLLERIRTGLKIPQEHATLLGRLAGEAKSLILPAQVRAIPFTSRRTQKIHDEIAKYATLNAVAGAFPVPLMSIATDLFVISMQVKMVHEIAQYWGHHVDRQAVHSLIGSAAGAAGMRLAVGGLFKTVPVLGSVAGAASAFVTTWALGKVADRYFEKDGQLSKQDVRELYRSAEAEALKLYEKSRQAICAKAGYRKRRLDRLERDFREGKISRQEFEKKLTALLGRKE